MTQTFDPKLMFGQEGSPEAGTPLPGPDDPRHQLAVFIGLLHGDKYAPPATDKYTAEGLKADQAAPAADSTTNPAIQTSGGVLGAARKYFGIKYVYGGTNPATGLDCSGFVQRVFADNGIMLPRVTYDQVKMGVGINSKDQLAPGDLIFFTGDGNRTNGHVGIYAGNGVMIDEPHTGSSVGYRTVNWGRVTAMRRVT